MSGSLVMIPLSLNPGLLSRTTPRSVYGAKPPSIVGNGGLTHNSLGCWTYKPHQGGWLVIKVVAIQNTKMCWLNGKIGLAPCSQRCLLPLSAMVGIGDLTHNPMAKFKPHRDGWLLIADVSHLIIKTTEAIVQQQSFAFDFLPNPPLFIGNCHLNLWESRSLIRSNETN